jgi:hypothetical protein
VEGNLSCVTRPWPDCYIYIMFSWLDPRRDVFGSNDLRWEVVVPFVDTSEIVVHHSKLQKGCTRLGAASDTAYQLLAHGRWVSLASSTTTTGRHDIAEILLKVTLKHQKSNQITVLIFSLTWLKYNRKIFNFDWMNNNKYYSVWYLSFIVFFSLFLFLLNFHQKSLNISNVALQNSISKK